MLCEPRAEFCRYLAVQHDDATEGRHGVGGERAFPRLLDRAGDCDPARVRVLDDHRRRERELARDATGAFEIGEVVVGERLAAELLDLREQMPPRAELAVVRRGLMGVLAV